jgi:hypothetical protein
MRFEPPGARRLFVASCAVYGADALLTCVRRSLLPAVLVTTGCAFGPTAPAGPIAGPGFKATNTWGASYVPVTFDETDENGERHTATMNTGAYFAPVLPLYTNLRLSPSTWFDVGASANLLDMGLSLRAGPLDAERELPFGVQTELLASTENARWRRSSLRFEAYPLLSRSRTSRRYGVLALGLSYGAQHFVVNEMPEEFGADPFEERGSLVQGPELDFQRRELRLEAFLGAHFRFQPGILTMVLAPHWALTSAPSEHTYGLGATGEHDWGISLLISPGFTWEEDDSHVRTSALPQ